MHKGIDILHLHWLTPYLKGKNSFAVAFYAVKLLGDVLLTRLNGIRIVWTIHNQVSHDTQFPRVEIFYLSDDQQIGERSHFARQQPAGFHSKGL